MTSENLALVADSNGEVFAQLQPVLTDLGLQAVAAVDGVEALRLIDSSLPSLVLADAALGILDGYALCARLRQEEKTRSIPIVLMSMSDDREGRMAALGAGADDCIAKPLDVEDARLRLQALLRRARLASSTNGKGRSTPLGDDSRAEPVVSATNLYRQIVGEVNRVLEQIRKNERALLAPVHEAARLLVKEIGGWSEMVSRALEKTEIEDLAAHHANVAIISVTIGKELGLPPDLLQRLAFLAFVHDLGMARVPSTILFAPRRLNREEFRVITEHPGHTAEILRAAGEEELAEIAVQEHEREKGQGYPHGLRGDEIREFAKILGVADVYEACTHPRPYRKALIPYDALQELIEMRGDFFHPRYIKALMNALTVFPLGSWVQLNTGESGRVTMTNRKNLMRPVIQVIWNAKGERLEQHKSVDLSKNSFLFINKPLYEDQLPRT
jgi:HD-GYP domain-containing protein (c-di-GMP phosphodiesterase class II)